MCLKAEKKCFACSDRLAGKMQYLVSDGFMVLLCIQGALQHAAVKHNTLFWHLVEAFSTILWGNSLEELDLGNIQNPVTQPVQHRDSRPVNQDKKT